MTKIRTAVVGAGKMGSIHAKVYSELDSCELIGVVDTQREQADKLAGRYNCRPFTDCEPLFGKVDAVTISAPTVHHRDLAKAFIENNVAVMIEKPLATNIKEGKEIVALAKKHNIVAAVGHSERCNPVVQAMKRLNIEPKFIEAHRISPYPFRSTDIGVVMDVMIHDIDIILSLAASTIKKIDAVGVNVIGEHEDICNARIVFDNGCIANVTASRLALKTERKVRVFSRQAYLSLDYLKKEGVVIKAAPNVDVVEWIKEHQQAGDFDFSEVNWPDLLHIEQLDIEDAEPLRLEQEAFLKAVAQKDAQPEVTAEEGLAAMQCAEKILAAIKKHKWD
ncbi:MAG: gfo/Idh/MocA family oxidoreductase [Planctomycetota bacterium]|nr:MAG: gfo/Idh/MocA family oxidoreductase [Planctomycetota bacterium]